MGDMVTLRGFTVKKISRKAAQICPPTYGAEAKWVPFSLFEEQSLLRAVKAAEKRAKVSELIIPRWKAEELGWVRKKASPQVVE